MNLRRPRQGAVSALVTLLVAVTVSIAACAGGTSSSTLEIDIDGGSVRGLPGAQQPDLAELRGWAERWSRTVQQVGAELSGTASSSPSSVRRVWTLVIPPDTESLERSLGRPRGALSEVAAVTMPPSDDTDGDAVVWLNREALQAIDSDAQEAVLRHEAVHVIERDGQRDGVPLWIEEGLAELIAHRGESVPQASADPVTLPSDDEFGVSVRAYANAWAACAWLSAQPGPRTGIDLVREIRDRIAHLGSQGRDVNEATDLALAEFGLSRSEVESGAAEVMAEWALSAPTTRAP